MAFKFTPVTEVTGLVIIDPKVFADDRGWFMETYKRSDFTPLGVTGDFVQASHSKFLTKGTLRGLHFQRMPHAQGKLIRCLRGKIFDVAVDLRRGSPTYGKYKSIELSEENKRLFWIPVGFAHGVCALENNSELEYLMTNEWSPGDERSLLWCDSTVGIDWPVDKPILSAKDAEGRPLEKLDHNFVW